jgi:ribosomal protection tetracycline resistance protein
VTTLNLGIFAHVDAGKTTLTERLLFGAGAIDQLGAVDQGTTHTDTLLLEQERGITIKAAVASLTVGDLVVNLVDTPGHPDFIAEVDRVLGVLDGAVLVISAVEGVQSHSFILMRALQRLGVPTLIFVNKVDRPGSDVGRTMDAISERLSSAAIPVSSVIDEGSASPRVAGWSNDAALIGRITEVLASDDDALLSSLVDGTPPPSAEWIRDELVARTREARVHPVFFGSALTGEGVDALLGGIAEMLAPADGDVSAPVRGSVFKIERGAHGVKVVYVRLRDGTINVRDVVHLDAKRADRVTSIRVPHNGQLVGRSALHAGEIGVFSGLRNARVGDGVGRRAGHDGDSSHFALPTLESVVSPRRADDRVRLGVALAQLAESDPFINLRLGGGDEIAVSLYGEVQKEVIAATLQREFGIEVAFSETSTVYVERPKAPASAVEFIAVAPNPFNATVGLRVEPAVAGSGVTYLREPELAGLMPNAYFRAVEESVHETLQQGIGGWRVIDCVVSMTHAGYWGKHGLGHQDFNKSMSSTGEDFRKLTPLVLATALTRSGSTVCEPIAWLRLEVPADAVAGLSVLLRALRAVVSGRSMHGRWCSIDGTIPAAGVHQLQRRLPDLTRGEGVAETGFDHHAPVRVEPPHRRRSGPDPFDRVAYLKQVGVRGTKATATAGPTAG